MQKQIHISIRIIDGLAKIVYWLFGFASIMLSILMVMYILGVPFGQFPGHIELPVQFDVIEKGKLVMENSTTDIKISDASGKISFGEIPKSISIAFLLVFLILASGIIWVFHLFIQFISNVKKGLVFKIQNIKFLKRIAALLIGLWAFSLVVSFIFNIMIVKYFLFSSIQFELKTGSMSEFLWAALFIWVLSHLFEKGAEIEEENSLTI